MIPRIKFLKIKYEIQSYETFKGHKNNTQIIPVQYPSKKKENLKRKYGTPRKSQVRKGSCNTGVQRDYYQNYVHEIINYLLKNKKKPKTQHTQQR